MEWLSLVVGGLLVPAIVSVTIYGWLKLPSDARVPVHHGLGSYDNYRSKTVGLLTWPVVGVVVYGILIAVASDSLQPNHASKATALIILPVALIIIFILEIGAIRAASRIAGPSS